jgi:chemosensory pili system protein ChpA (sensor histidine kinase/response regulator)
MEFDIGPLTWVKGEMDNAMEAARTALADWNGEDTNPLKAAAAHLHQVYGALQIVDLQGVSLVTSEVERLLADMAAQQGMRNKDTADTVIRAIGVLKSYLDGLMVGGVHAELKLAPIYQEIVARRGGEAPAPSELFYPDTSVRALRKEPEAPMDDAARGRAIHSARSQYQRGLLLFLQNKDAMSGLMQMDQAVRQVERLAPGPAQFTFWWTAAGLMEMLRRGGVPTDYWLKRLCGRIDLQMRRLMEGSRQLADRLFRDVLYYVAQDDTPDGRGAEARERFQLQHYFPAEVSAPASDQLKQLAALKDNLGTAKDHWIRYCAGRTESLEPFQHAALAVFEAATRLPNGAMQTLARMVQAVAKRLPGVADATQNEALQLEMATALLLALNAAEHFKALGVEFDRQSEVQAMRLQAAIDPNFDTSRIPDVDMLDEFSRHAQEKLVVAQVTQEIQANLNQVEEILDRFFRDAKERAGLPMVPSLMKQILGALNILELEVAAELVGEAIRRIQHFTEPDAQIAPENLNWVAEALSTLGLYMDALRYGKDDSRALAGLLAQPEVVAAPAEKSVEAQIREETERLKESVEQWAVEGVDAGQRETLKSELGQLARDADLIGDADLRGQADVALKALAAAAAPEMVKQAVEGLGGAPAAAPAPSAESVRLAAASDEDVDRELLSTYIEEANEVLGTIAVQVSRLHVSPYDTEAFTVVRRGFHTLKGSGRMVGLTDLAELAWEVEQTLNTWLRDEKAPTTELLGFLEDVSNAFQVWVTELEEQGLARVAAGHLTQIARNLRGAAEPLANTQTNTQTNAPAPSAPNPPSGSPVELTLEEPPPKSEAGVSAPHAQAAGEDTLQGPATGHEQASDALPGEDASIHIGDHSLPLELFNIFTDEVAQRLADLGAALAEMGHGHRPTAWENFIRAAHTLAGISRTTGFMPLADAAHEVELWAGRWPDKTQPLTTVAISTIEEAVGELAEAIQGILQKRFPEAMPQVAEWLAALEQEATAAEPAEAMEIVEATEETAELSPALEEASAAEPLVIDTRPATPVAPPSPAALPVPNAVDDLDDQLLPIFLEEAAELMPRIGESLREWRVDPATSPARDALKRTLHTLKGSSRMAGAMVLGEAVHALETRILELDGAPASANFLDGMEAEYDRFAEIIERLKGGGTSAPAQSVPVAPPQAVPAPSASPAPVAAAPHAAPPRQADTAARHDDEIRTRQALRLKSDILDTLLNEAGEVSISRARIENVLKAYKQTAQELASNVDRLRGQLRELEIQAETQMRSRLSQVDESHFDPLEFDRFSRLQELTRLMAESVNDVSTAQDNLLAGLNEADGALVQQTRMTRTLQQELMRIRMVPLSTLSERLHRVVRQASKETKRKAQLELDGGQTELDRAVLDKIAAPLEHLVRNAVAHGIEAPDVRDAAGKREYGEVRLAARQESNEIILTLSDDGAGVDFAAVQARAEAQGWLEPGEQATPEQLEQLLFRSGFSTAEEVTELAGRGVGLDVVKNEIAGIGGRVRLESEPGKGSRFTIRLPLTLALTQVVLARAGGQTYALPANLVTLVREVRVDQVQALHEAGYMDFAGEMYPLRTLAELVGRKAQPGEGRFRTILLLKAGEQRLALRVDVMEGNFEAVVKNIGPQLARIVGISGATVLGDGRVALILNPFLLAERAPHLSAEEEVKAEEQAPLVMVVDDSLTVRKFTSRFLEREGFRVIAARDGVEALEMLEEEMPAVMLLDIEMPRMDGFEVARTVRSSSQTKELPIIMITSRTAEKHRGHAMELGVNAYMGKPYQEEELLAEIKRLAGLEVPA